MQEKQKMTLRSNKIMALFRMFSWDLLFFYSFSVLFLTQVKGFSEAEIMFTSAVVSLVPILLQYPFNIIAKKIGPLKSVRLGSFCFFAFTIGILLYDNIVLLYINYCLQAIGSIFLVPNISVLAIKNLKVEGKDSEFSKIEGRGASLYYIFNAVASIGLGYLFDVNPYLTMSFSVIASAICLLLAFILRDESAEARLVLENVKPQQEKIKKSKKRRSISLPVLYVLCMAFCFYGLLMVEIKVDQLLFQEVLFDAVIIGWVNFGISITKGMAGEIFKLFKGHAKIFITFMPICYLSILLVLALIFIFVQDLLVLQILVVAVCCLLPFFNIPFKVGTKDFIRQNVEEAAQMNAFSALFIVRNGSQLIFSFTIGSLLTGMSISSSLLYIVFLGGGLFALSQLIYFIVKRVKEKKISVFLR